jgi:hypothetical protein
MFVLLCLRHAHFVRIVADVWELVVFGPRIEVVVNFPVPLRHIKMPFP